MLEATVHLASDATAVRQSLPHFAPLLIVQLPELELGRHERRPIELGLLDPTEPVQVAVVEFNRLKKESIDYTISDGNDAPLLCIEFDGLQEGFNLGTRYRSNLPPDPWRNEIMELKLRVAHGQGLASEQGFPYFVLSSKHFAELTAELRLTIVDGIIGEVLANKRASKKFAQGFRPEYVGLDEQSFSNLQENERWWIVQDWVTDTEIDADLELNPISQLCGKLWYEMDLPGFGLEQLYYPEPDWSLPLSERVKQIEAQVRHGAKCILHTKEFGDIERSRVIQKS